MADENTENPITEQGVLAAEQGCSRDECPYAEGDNREAWLAAFDAATPKGKK